MLLKNWAQYKGKSEIKKHFLEKNLKITDLYAPYQVKLVE